MHVYSKVARGDLEKLDTRIGTLELCSVRNESHMFCWYHVANQPKAVMVRLVGAGRRSVEGLGI